MSTQSFEESIAEYLELTKELIGEESLEHLPPGSPAPYDQSGPPYECPLRLDPTTIRNFALSIGDSNPLFTVPEYGRSTRYGCQLAPGPILAMVRYPSVHGAVRDGGFPYAQLFSGTAWEFFDVIRVGSKFRSTKTTSEVSGAAHISHLGIVLLGLSWRSPSQVLRYADHGASGEHGNLQAGTRGAPWPADDVRGEDPPVYARGRRRNRRADRSPEAPAGCPDPVLGGCIRGRESGTPGTTALDPPRPGGLSLNRLLSRPGRGSQW